MKKKNLTEIFIFMFLWGTSIGFLKALKAFIKPFEAPQRSVEIKIKLKSNFHFNTFWNKRGGKG